MRYLTMFLKSKLCTMFKNLYEPCNATATTARRSFDVAGKKKRSCCNVMVSDVMGQCQQWDLHCSVYFYKRAHEYPVLDRRPGSNDLELDFR